MVMEWNDKQPIYRQLRDLVVERIIDGSFPEGESVPSVRQVATDYQINHLSFAKAYQELVDLGLLETRRGLGMFVTTGAKESLTDHEQQKFLVEELPAFVERVKKLGIDLDIVAEKLRQAGVKS